MRLPEEFTNRMRRILGQEYGAFEKSYEEKRKYGLRVNMRKITPEAFEQLAPFHLTKIPWIPGGYYYLEEDAPARHPFYHAGLYYLQEPSAMTPASVLGARPGERVLDLCAAPGGKATALGAALQDQGLLVANDISASRARALLKNIEVFGIPNSFVTNEVPARLEERFLEFFDRVLVDAPCSGEGMFRKDEGTIRAWYPEKPLECARIQRDIILRAADMLRPGGRLLYSTCTFAVEENEEVIAWLLRKRPDMELLEIPFREGFSPGLERALTFEGWESLGEEAPSREEQDSWRLNCCVRLWPHKTGGEGHFLALLQKKGEQEPGSLWNSLSRDNGSKEEDGAEKAAGDALADQGGGKHRGKGAKTDRRGARNAGQRSPKGGLRGGRKGSDGAGDGKGQEQRKILEEFFADVSGPLVPEQMEIRKDQAYYVSRLLPEVAGIPFLRNGLYLGELKKNRFEPSQSLAMALKKSEYASAIDLDFRDERVQRYLQGETIEVQEEEAVRSSGWQLVCVNGYPLGWGKLVNGLLKNKYHPGWRSSGV